MPYVVTQACCSDASCVVACPVNCIHPAPGDPGFAEAEMVYVDPAACVDCGACATACPVDAVKPHTKLTDAELPFVELNALYYRDQPHSDRTPMALVPPQPAGPDTEGLKVAVVGAGPAGLYAADELLRRPGVGVDVYDRLPTPYGLVRGGVAPDHQDTRGVTSLFAAIEGQPGFGYRLGVEVGRDVTQEELARHYSAVIYAVGASSDRALRIPGEHLAGVVPATAVVGWYNAHPDHRDTYVDLTHERVVVVGNGNVALDVARLLTADPEELAATDISAEALATLRGSNVREVVVLGRRGPAEAAFTVPELVGLAGLEGIDVVVDNGGEPIRGDGPKLRLLRELQQRPARPGRRRVVLRFRTTPLAAVGDDTVAGLQVQRTRLVDGPDGQAVEPVGGPEVLPAGMVVRSVGYRGLPVPGLPYDEATGTVPNDRGRVAPGTYVTGWVKRGPRGFIGTNKACAQETVTTLLEDLGAGTITTSADVPALDALLAGRGIEPVDLAGWRALEQVERERGRRTGRVRERRPDVEDMLAVARAGGRGRGDGADRPRRRLRRGRRPVG